MKTALRNLLIVGFLGLWLGPVLYYALTNSPPPWLPDILQRRTNVSRLFSSEVPVWGIYAVQYRTAESETFRFLKEDNYFRMKPFGKRTRMQKVIAIASPTQREELCYWLRKRLEISTKEAVASMRIVAFPNTSLHITPWRGYEPPDPKSIDPETFEILTQVDFPVR